MRIENKKITRTISGILAGLMLASPMPLAAFADTATVAAASESVGTVNTGEAQVIDGTAGEQETSNADEPIDYGSVETTDIVNEETGQQVEDAFEWLGASIEVNQDSDTLSVGDMVELTLNLTRQDVETQRQWQVRYREDLKNTVTIADLPEGTETEYPYSNGESLDYYNVLVDMTEEELLEYSPNALWKGIELYRAVRAAADAAGYEEPISIANGTYNYALMGYDISAEVVDGELVVTFAKDDEVLKATIDTETGKLKDPVDRSYTCEWKDVDGATGYMLPVQINEDSLYYEYRCIVTPSAEYVNEAMAYAERNGLDYTQEDVETITTGYLSVSATPESMNPPVEEETPDTRSIWQKIWDWLKALWKKFVSLFVRG